MEPLIRDAMRKYGLRAIDVRRSDWRWTRTSNKAKLVFG
jgi:hypothetical protein